MRVKLTMWLAWLIVGLCVPTILAMEQYPEQGDVVPNDPRLGRPIPESTGSELTIVSWNIRNLGAYNRSIKDYNAMVNLVDEADIVVLQEVGLGLLRSDMLTDAQAITLRSVQSLWQIRLGDSWEVVVAPDASGSGGGRETSMVAHRKVRNGNPISVTWEGFHELGASRDMAVWKIDLSDNTTILAGSVHLTPSDPARGQEMINMAQWLVDHKNEHAMVMGDMNWGYQRTSGVENYLGEEKIIELDESGDIYHVFKNFSYLGSGNARVLRTNMGFRRGAFFYDQFLLSPPLSEKLTHGANFLQDTGMIAFGVYNSYMQNSIQRAERSRGYGLSRYSHYENGGIDQGNVDKATNDISTQSNNDATWSLSDHRPIWLKINVE